LDFIIGIAIYEISKEMNIGNSILELIAVVIAFVSLIIFPYIDIKYAYASIFWVPTALIICVFSSKKSGVISILLRNKLLVTLGNMSFPLFMFHIIVINWYRILESHTVLSYHPYIGAVLCLLFTIFISSGYVYVVKRLGLCRV